MRHTRPQGIFHSGLSWPALILAVGRWRTLIPLPGLEPGPEPSEGPIQFTTPSGRIDSTRADDWIRTSMIPPQKKYE
ncbi:MAG: hypothetical protein JWM11_6428 [Planctomycetaceae bacterium]|nr:hypothetical protein [Planctomycetaceae bacterium]